MPPEALSSRRAASKQLRTPLDGFPRRELLPELPGWAFLAQFDQRELVRTRRVVPVPKLSEFGERVLEFVDDLSLGVLLADALDPSPREVRVVSFVPDRTAGVLADDSHRREPLQILPSGLGVTVCPVSNRRYLRGFAKLQHYVQQPLPYRPAPQDRFGVVQRIEIWWLLVGTGNVVGSISQVHLWPPLPECTPLSVIYLRHTELFQQQVALGAVMRGVVLCSHPHSTTLRGSAIASQQSLIPAADG